MPDTSQLHINTNGKEANSYDAIVIGSGISGGWAAKELCEKGMKTLVLERGRDVQHIKDYPTATLSRWELPHRGQITQKTKTNNPLITKAAGYDESTQHFFVQDKEQPVNAMMRTHFIKVYADETKKFIEKNTASVKKKFC